ncbi:MAG: DNA translocase FtsK 4TM domain-containing protein [Phycisphaeraceae bacterium]|nr:MAG: DNA translocase FtsK 4TM domain-containing protein [Phycisphaeraceae bacterium]
MATRSSISAGRSGRGNPSTSTSIPSSGATLASGVLLKLAIFLALASWAYLAVALWSFNPTDWPSHTVTSLRAEVTNLCGPIGAWIAYSLVAGLGWGAWVLAALTGLGLILTAMGRPPAHAWTRLVGVLVLVVAVCGAQRLLFPSSGPYPEISGGKLGVALVDRLIPGGGPVGAGVLMLLGIAIGLVVAVDEIVSWIWKVSRDKGVPAAFVAGRLAFVGAGKGLSAVGAVGGMVGGAANGGGGGVRGHSEEVSGRSFSHPAPSHHGLHEQPPRRPGLLARLASLFRGRDGLPDDGMNEVQAQALDRMRQRRAKPRHASDAPPEVAFPGEGGMTTAPGRETDHADEPNEPTVVEDPDVVAEHAPGDDRRDQGTAETDGARDDDELPGAPQVFDTGSLREKMSRLPVVFGQDNREVATDADLAGLQNAEQLEVEGRQYRFPGMDLLENPEENFNEKLESYVREQAACLESAMRVYGIDGEVVGIESGPVITLFDVRLAPGTKVAAVSAVSSDIARALKSVNIRIVANQAGRDTIGIEVPNTQKEKVRLKELMARTDRFASMKLPMFMGKDASGEPLIEDLAKMPHMLIAGTTGSGKSVCMNTIIMGFLYTKKPSELKMVLVDPKMVEMSQFRDIPHLMCPVVTEMSKAAAILEWACTKMDERYELLAEAGCRDISAYNDLSWDELKERLGIATDEEGARVPRKLPYMVFIIDELADLMMTAKEVESHIIRIAQKARAVGMHLILATQRPQANVVTGLIKSNMPCRVAFRVNSGMDSRIVLDGKGAELLLGHGDMLFLNPRTNKLTRAQGTLVDDKEIRSVVRFMRDVAGPSFERQLLSLRKPSEDGTGLGQLSDEERLLQSKNNSSASLKAAQEDPLFERAVEIVLESRRGSVSLLQRRLAIGYTRSSRLIDLMGIAGIISDHKGSVARDVLITPEEWEMMKQMAKEEAAQKGIAWPVKGKEEQGALFAADEPAGPKGAAQVEPKPAPKADPADESDDEFEDDAADDDSDRDEGESGEADPEDEYEEDESDEPSDEEPPFRPDARRNS